MAEKYNRKNSHDITYSKQSSDSGTSKIEGDFMTSNADCFYTKRPGTSGISGHLYETKLLSLLLLRALNDTSITTFNLGTNIDGIGAFDDIVLKYEANDEEKPKVLFIQAKHKEGPDQNKVTIQDLFKEYGDFCLYKYFDSYLKIRNKFNANNNDNIFKNAFKDVVCDFIIYTPAIENMGGRDLLFEDDSSRSGRLLHTDKNGKAFQLIYSDNEVERLVQSLLDIRTQLLGKTLMKFLFKDNYNNLLVDDLMKTYHVFLAQHVIEVTSEAEQHLKGRFRDTFFWSKDRYLVILQETICKEFSLKYCTCNSDKIEELVQKFNFKLPLNFGNVNFSIGGNSRKTQRRLIHICTTIKRLLDRAKPIESYLLVKIDNSMVGPAGILKQKDLEIYRLGGLVGNLLVLDKKTLRLKFNESIESLPPFVIRLFELLKKECPLETDFNKYRFEINAFQFPKLLIGRTMYEVLLAKEFLNSLKFYTNEACENHVANLLIAEISKCYKLGSCSDNQNFRLKSESIFLKVHDIIQKWWKQPNKAAYLNETCKYYNEAKEQLFNYSLLSTLHSLYITKINSYGIQFDQFDNNFANLKEISKGFLNITTNNIILTSIKLFQYLHCNSVCSSYIFLNLDFILSEKCIGEVLAELREVNCKKIVITCENTTMYDKIIILMEVILLDVIVITKTDLRENILFDSMVYSQFCDNRIALIDLNVESQRKILNETYVKFQGYTVPFKSLIIKNNKIVDSATLWSILNKEIIQIGRKFCRVQFTEFEDSFIDRTMCRFISLKTDIIDNVYIINDLNNTQVTPEDTRDIIVISDKVHNFIKCCESHKDQSIHWFVKENGYYIWQKSRGSLTFMYKHVNKGSCQSHIRYNPKTLLDIDDKVIILCAGPGMGKSTLMTYLSIKTKIKYPNYWILNINCLDYKNLFSDWQVRKTVLGIEEIIKFLYMVSLKSINNIDDFNVSIGNDGNIYTNNLYGQKMDGLAYLEVEVFNYLYNNGQVAIIFDGFDEISPDYMEQVVTLLEILKNSKVCRLWITTRPYNIIDNLEQKLGTFAFILQKLSLKEQHDLLVKLWGITVGQKANDRLQLYVENFFRPISFLINDLEREFTSFPLHIYMIAEIYQEFFKYYYDPYIPRLSDDYMVKIKDINYIKLYETFVNKKFYDIRFGEKKPYIYDRDPDMKKMIETAYVKFIKQHKKLGALVVFDSNVQGLFSQQDRIEINEALDCVRTGEERTGIIDRVVDEEPQFVHLTFAEYFAAEYLCDKLKTGKCSDDVWIYLFNTIFVTDKNINVRNFFNLKLSKDTELFKLAENLKIQYKQVIFEKLLKQTEASSLSNAAMEKFESNAMFLLNCIKDVLTKNNLGDFIKHITRKKKISCTLCSTADSRSKTMLKTMLKFVKETDESRYLELFKCGDVPLFNALGIAITYSGRFKEDIDLIDIMLISTDDINIALELFTSPYNMGLLKTTIVHVLIMNNCSTRDVLLKHLLRFNKEQRMKIFNTVDSDGRLVAHFAAEQGDIDFFVVLESILDTEQFIQICMTCDNIGRTPVDYLACNIRDPKQIDLVNTLRDMYYKNPIYLKKQFVSTIINRVVYK